MTSTGVLLVVLSLVAAFAAADKTCAVPSSNACDIATLSCCDKKFRLALGFNDSFCDNSAVYSDPFCYRDKIESAFFLGGIQGLVQVCDAFNVFKDCLDISMRDCMTYPYYLKHKYPRDIAFRTQVLYAQLQFACGAGLDSYIHNEYCLPSTWQNATEALKKCRMEVNGNLNDGGDPCYALNEYTSCVQVPFQRSCSLESSWWVCEYHRVTAQIFYPQCRGTCMINNVVTKKK